MYTKDLCTTRAQNEMSPETPKAQQHKEVRTIAPNGKSNGLKHQVLGLERSWDGNLAQELAH